MLRARFIPVLLLGRSGLVKTVRFASPRYIGDPLNAVRIFNDKEVDELVVLDIQATREGRGPDFARVADLASECFMPLAYGGGVRTIDDISRLIACGVEKVVLGTAAAGRPGLVRDAARVAGSQSIVVSIDVKRRLLGGYACYTEGGRRRVAGSAPELAQAMASMGAGEILLTSIDADGSMQGYDLALVRAVARAVEVPVIAAGGAGSVEHLVTALEAGAAAAAAGSLFVYQGRQRGVLINYPGPEEISNVTKRLAVPH